MGFRFRKSIKAGPVRFNFSKSGMGYSVGTKGFQVTKKAGGGTRTTASIPGTGISYVQDSKKPKRGTTMRNNSTGKFLSEPPSRQNNHNSNTPVTKTEMILAWCTGFIGGHKFYRKKYGIGILYVLTVGLFLIGWLGDSISITWQYFTAKKGKQNGNLQKVISYLAAFLCVCMLGSCGGSSEPNVPPATEPAPTAISVVETTAETETEYENAISETVIEPTTDTTTATETANETIAETTEPEPVERDYVLNTSSMKIHKPGCKSVKDIKDSNRMDFHGTFEELIARGYTACGNCHPY